MNGFVEFVKDAELDEFCAITTTGVTVEVTPLTQDMLEATVEVIDNNGKVHEVKPLDLSAGEDEIEFNFVTAVKADNLEGIWTVDGVKYNLTLKAQLNKFRTITSELELYDLLEKMGIENLDSENATAYVSEKADFLNELDENEKELTVAAIQNYVDDVNADQVSDTEKAKVAQAVVDALGNNVELRAALAHPAFTKVNNDWIQDVTEPSAVDGYATDLATALSLVTKATAATVTTIQDAIDGVNENVIAANRTALNINTIGNDTSVDKTKLNALKDMIEAYAEVDEDGKYVITTNQDALDNIEEQVAVADVLAATTASRFKSRVTTLADVVNTASSKVIDLEKYVDTNGKAYIDVIKDLNSDDVKLTPEDYGVTGKVNEASEIQAVIEAVNQDVKDEATVELYQDLVDAIEGFSAIPTSTQRTKYLNALNALELKQVSSNKANVDKYITATYTGPIDTAAKAVIADPSTATVQKAAIQDEIDKANVAVINAADEDGIIAALNVMEIKNVKPEYAADYVTEINAAAADKTAVQTAVNDVNAAKALDGALEIINNQASTTEQVRAALVDVAVGLDAGTATTDADFINLSKQAQLEVAELVIEARDDVSTYPTKKFADLDDIMKTTDGTGELRTAIDAHAGECVKFNNIGDLDDVATTTTTTKTALDAYAYDEYVALSNTDKLAVANEINKLAHVDKNGVKTPYDFTGADAVETFAEANAIIDAAIAAIK